MELSGTCMKGTVSYGLRAGFLTLLASLVEANCGPMLNEFKIGNLLKYTLNTFLISYIDPCIAVFNRFKICAVLPNSPQRYITLLIIFTPP